MPKGLKNSFDTDLSDRMDLFLIHDFSKPLSSNQQAALKKLLLTTKLI